MSAPLDVPFTTIRVVNRLLLRPLMQAAAAGRMGRDFVDALILMAVVQANIAPVTRDPDLNRAFSTLDDPPPDELRRPVSVNAVAQSLKMPYETVRRRVRRLAETGACEFRSGGVVVPTTELRTPAHMASMLQIWEAMRAFYYRLCDAGVFDDLVSRDSRERWAANSDEIPVRAVMRAGSDFVLRFADNVEQVFANLLEAVVWLAIMLGNTEALADSETGGPGAAANDFVDDSLRRPARARDVAERLGAPAETIRRQVAHLLEIGFVVRVRGGLVIPAEVLSRPNATRLMHDNFVDLQRLFAQLARLGVLGLWDRQREAVRGAA